MALFALPALGSASPAVAGQVIKTFSSTGAEQTYTVPPGVTVVHTIAVGARGGDGDFGGGGGFGAIAGADLPVTPGQLLYVEVGANGTTISPAFNGGGAGGDTLDDGGAGGGASDVRTASSSLPSRLIVAGGGGGGGAGNFSLGGAGGMGFTNILFASASGGGMRGADGSASRVGDNGGKGGGSTAPSSCPASPGCGGAASGGGSSPGSDGSSGSGGSGGSGAVSFDAGGGGGGGYFGGGGGASDSAGGASGAGGGGGAGSSFIVSAAKNGAFTADTSGTPQVKITYLDATPPDTTLGSSKINRRKHKARFAFGGTDDNGAPITLLCKIDRKAFAPCLSPGRYKHLKRGRHTFQVEAMDAAGNLDPTPAVKKFRI